MSEPINPELAETQLRQKFEKDIVEYKKWYNNWQEAKKERCDCDRMECGRCMSLRSITRSLDRILNPWMMY